MNLNYYYNGEFLNNKDLIPHDILSEGLQFGFGIFETLLWEWDDNKTTGQTYHVKYHLDRLRYSAEQMSMPLILRDSEFTDIVQKLTAMNPQADRRHVIKIMVMKNKEWVDLLIQLKPYPYRLETSGVLELSLSGVSLGTFSSRRHSSGLLLRHKTMNYMAAIIDRAEASRKGWLDGLYLNEREEVSEGSAINLFFEKAGVLYTPHLECGILPGIMRRIVIETLSNKGIKVTEGYFNLKDVESADRVYATNSLIGVLPVHTLNQMTFNIERTQIGELITPLK